MTPIPIIHLEHNYCGSHVREDLNNVDKYDTSLLKKKTIVQSEHNYSTPVAVRSRNNRCPNCGKVYVYNFNLEKHSVRCTRYPGLQCRMCGLRFKSHCDLYIHRMRTHPVNDWNTLQDVPWSSEVEAHWSHLQGSDRENMKEMYELHKASILAPNHVSDIVSIYNLPCQNDINSSVIIAFVSDIYEPAKRTFKISFAAGLILQHIVTGEYRYWRPYRNQEFFDDAFTISCHDDLNNLKDQLDTFDFVDYAMKQRPDTKYRCFMITQMKMFVFETSFTLGFEPVKLPAFLTNNNSVIYFDKRKIGKYKTPCRDYLCAFRCVTYHKYSSKIEVPSQRFEVQTMMMFKKWQNFMFDKCHKTVNGATFKGVTNDQFVLFEECFSVSIDVYEKVDKDVVLPVYKSTHSYDSSMVLNIYNKHLRYVTRFKNYAKKFQCHLCDKLFVCMSKLTRYTTICEDETKISFKGGIFNSQRDLWQELEHF